MRDRTKILELIGKLDDEAFTWIVLSFMEGKKMIKYQKQIWPDGLGGFGDRKTIRELRINARKWLQVYDD